MSRHDLTLSPGEQGLKAAAKRLVRAAGGVEAAAEESRPGKTQLSSYGNPHTPDFIPADAIADLEAVTHGTAGHPIVTRHLAARAGYALVMLPQAEAGPEDWNAAVGALVRETGEAMERVAGILADGRVERREVERSGVIGELGDVIDRAVALRALCEAAL